SQRAQETVLAYACLLPWIIGFVVFTAGAMLYSFYLAFTTTDMLTGTRFVGLANITEMLQDKLVAKSLMVTATYSLGSIPLGVVVSLAIAVLLNQELPLRSLWRTLYYLPSVVSGVAVAILWSWIFNPRIGLINSVLAALGIEGPKWIFSEQWAVPSLIIMSLWGTGGNMLLYLAGLQSIPTALYDAAKIDGATAIRRFQHVTLPMLSPTIFFTLVMGIIGAFQFFTEPLVMTNGGPNNATLSILLYIYRKSFVQLHFGYASLLAWVLFLIILAFTLLVIRSSAVWVYYEGELRK
ncbi:MAG: carbohydrate ABC transporter permease, partial [Anaerolineae bacterium]